MMKNINLHPIMMVLIYLLIMSTAPTVQADEWIPVTSDENLRNFMIGAKLEWKLPNGDMSRGEYRADGTGTMYAWGAEIARTWEVKDNDQICVTSGGSTQCWQLEKNTADPALYRARDVATGILTEIRMTDTEGRAIVTGKSTAPGNKGGAAAPSASEIAAQLANPNTALASLTFKNQFRWFEGDLPDADDQSGYTLLFQPILPFPLENGDKIIWRPAVPIIMDQPVFDSAQLDFDGESGLGDIGFDLTYAHTTETGILLGAGFVTTLPTSTSNELRGGQWALGPEILLGKASSKYVLAVLPTHQWDVAGWTDKTVNVTTTSVFVNWVPGGGWLFASNPVISHDWHADQWTIPINLTVGKTVIYNGRPWKLAVELNYYIENSDDFAAEWMLSFNITPVVNNILASIFK